MDEKFIAQLFAELKAATGDAIGLVVAALARQLDATKLTEDLRSQIAAAVATKLISPVAIELATHALAAAEAETALRNPKKH